MVIDVDPFQGDEEVSDKTEIRYVDINQKSVFSYLSMKLVIIITLCLIQSLFLYPIIVSCYEDYQGLVDPNKSKGCSSAKIFLWVYSCKIWKLIFAKTLGLFV